MSPDSRKFTWHKQHHHLAFAIAAAEQCDLRFHECMEMLDSIKAHAEEEFARYALVTVADAQWEDGTPFAGDFIVIAPRVPTADEFDMGALLVLRGFAKETPLSRTVELFVHEETAIAFQR